MSAEAVAAKPRFTARALVLLLVVAALAASYASSLRAYLDQRAHVASLHSRIEDSRSAIAALEREKSRWRDDAYVATQARARFAFGFPGEIGYQVLDEQGNPLDPDDGLDTGTPVAEDEPEWWETTLDSVETAGNPPRRATGDPDERIVPPRELRSPGETTEDDMPAEDAG